MVWLQGMVIKKTRVYKRLDCMLKYDNILTLKVNINWRGLYDYLMNTRIFTLILNKIVQ